ncbi:hypothetical protein [Simonsiella muelleri]|uniref:hypothetical protein n=1 Tax=Simonsiella muelleri TaxID=72 RepID=UPI001319ECFE|nr:hypothetical protein [Simonsiella muelleri]
MKNDTSLKTMVLAIVLAMHGGLIAWAWKMQPQTETVNTENLTFVDLNALEVGSDGGDGAAAGAQGLAAAPPPKKETEPTPVAPPHPQPFRIALPPQNSVFPLKKYHVPNHKLWKSPKLILWNVMTNLLILFNSRKLKLLKNLLKNQNQ